MPIDKKIDLDDFEQVGIHPNSVFKFFNSLYLTKKPREDAPDSKYFSWAIRYYSGFIYFTLGDLYHHFISWLTQYYPFSYLYPGSLLNAKNRLLRKFVITVEKIANNSKLPLLICGNDFDGNMFTFEALLYKNENDKFVKTLELLLQKEVGSVYIRRASPKKIKIIIPNEVMQTVYSKLGK